LLDFFFLFFASFSIKQREKVLSTHRMMEQGQGGESTTASSSRMDQPAEDRASSVVPTTTTSSSSSSSTFAGLRWKPAAQQRPLFSAKKKVVVASTGRPVFEQTAATIATSSPSSSAKDEDVDADAAAAARLAESRRLEAEGR